MSFIYVIFPFFLLKKKIDHALLFIWIRVNFLFVNQLKANLILEMVFFKVPWWFLDFLVKKIGEINF
jgi:hypothetical protein